MSLLNFIIIIRHPFKIITFHYFAIYSADQNNLESLTKQKLNGALHRFIPKVTKTKGKGVNTPVTHYIR